MNYRLATIHARESFGVDVTRIIPINVFDPISALLIELDVTSTDAAFKAHQLECLTKIEVVDGSDVLFSLSGKEADALDWYHNGGKFRPNYNYYMAGGCQRYIGLNFGRHLWDSELALDPKKFDNLQLKLTLDIDGGGGVPSANAITVWAAMFDEKVISPIGFLMSKEIKNYPMGPSAHEYTAMPVDFPYRKLLIRQQTVGTEPGQKINTVKLSEDGDKRIPFEEEIDNILRTIDVMYPPCREEFFGVVSAAPSYLYITPTTRVTAQGEVWRGGVLVNDLTFFNGDGGRLDGYANVTPKDTMVHVTGAVPHGVYSIPMGLPDVIEDWYDVSRVKSLILDVLGRPGALATDFVQVMLQQLRRY